MGSCPFFKIILEISDFFWVLNIGTRSVAEKEKISSDILFFPIYETDVSFLRITKNMSRMTSETTTNYLK